MRSQKARRRLNKNSVAEMQGAAVREPEGTLPPLVLGHTWLQMRTGRNERKTVGAACGRVVGLHAPALSTELN